MDWDRVGTDRSAMAVKLELVLRLLAEAAWRHPDEGWARRAEAMVPGFRGRFTPPCAGEFDARVNCDEAHLHSLYCGNPDDVCTLCRKTNAEHRAAWEALK